MDKRQEETMMQGANIDLNSSMACKNQNQEEQVEVEDPAQENNPNPIRRSERLKKKFLLREAPKQATKPNASGRSQMKVEAKEDTSSRSRSAKSVNQTVKTKSHKKETMITTTWRKADASRSQEVEKVDPYILIPVIGLDLSVKCLVSCSRSDYGAIAGINRNFRALVHNGLLYRLRREAGIVEHWICFSIELLEWEVFDPITKRSMKLPRLETGYCFECSDKESLAVGTQLLVFGRDLYSPLLIYTYSFLTNTWSRSKAMNYPRCMFAAASMGTIAIVAGGCDARGKLTRVAEMYNSETDEWIPLPDMNIARKLSTGVFMDGKFYVLGGKGGDNYTISCGEVFDLVTRTWEVIPSMYLCPMMSNALSIEAPPLLGVVNNELYCAHFDTLGIFKYDKGRNSWEPKGRLPESAQTVNGWGIAFRACGDRIITLSGRPQGTRGGFLEVNSWTPGEGPVEWELLASKNVSGFVYTSTITGC